MTEPPEHSMLDYATPRIRSRRKNPPPLRDDFDGIGLFCWMVMFVFVCALLITWIGNTRWF